MNKINKEKLDEIKCYIEAFNSYNNEINKLNQSKENQLKNIINILEQTNFLIYTKNINEVKSAKFNIWHDCENPNWMKINLNIFAKKKYKEFKKNGSYSNYANSIRDLIYNTFNINSEFKEFLLITIR